MFWVYAALAVSLVSFFVAAYFYNWVKKLPTANPKLDEVGALIREGAFTFLRREYRVLGLFSIIVMAVIFLFFPQPVWAGAGVGKNLLMVFAYLCGTVLSALAGYVGISIATIANLKAATAARESIQKSFMAGFRGGAVMGMAVIGTSLAGAALIYIISRDADVIMAFSFGASSLALFAKAGGGIFTKTADIAADLTGKVELGIPEDGRHHRHCPFPGRGALPVLRHHAGPAGLCCGRAVRPPGQNRESFPRAERRHLSHLRCVRGAHFHRLPCFRL